ncbi:MULTISPECIES: acyl-CoA thioesterase domain-containing protein [unclassified Acinetobacter]|uniref:acyl-CoA thioesterase n=1 Tax=unclassified Acinetobacter TaxID=196816 RepID=UPI00257622EA|nr:MULTISPECIES: acyl-CoA thioesterase domain-containing protein [unclassified Acinetobacter]MDM1758262.1 thioesterase family protein [Acinetobacter sp. 256-1]MDM1760951.1 thioesterase family protein [Acinetobacter sp. 251-1]
MDSLTQQLTHLLNVQQIDQYLFQGQTNQLFGSHLFGGQILAQALIAASKTTDRPAHSLHAYFIRSGRTDLPILFKVENLRDGSSFSARQVHALQDGKVIFSAMLSFAQPEQGLEFQISAPDYPHPDTLIPEQEHKMMIVNDIPESRRAIVMQQFNLLIHPVEFANPFHPIKAGTKYAEYFRSFDKIEGELDTIAMHQAIAAYYSDYNLLTTSLRPHGVSYANGGVRSASLDHTIHFHHHFRVDEWMLYDMYATRSSQARGLNFGEMWQNDRLVCSVSQESLMRQRTFRSNQ